MAQKNMDLWLDRFDRESGIKSSIILHGNTTDIMLNQNGRYESVIKCVVTKLLEKGYESIVKWDRVDGY